MRTFKTLLMCATLLMSAFAFGQAISGDGY